MGLMTPDEVAATMREESETGRPFTELAVERGHISAEHMARIAKPVLPPIQRETQPAPPEQRTPIFADTVLPPSNGAAPTTGVTPSPVEPLLPPPAQPTPVEPAPAPAPALEVVPIVEPEPLAPAPAPDPVLASPEPIAVAPAPEPEPVVVAPAPQPVAVAPAPEPVVVAHAPEPEMVAQPVLAPVPEPEPEPQPVAAAPEPEREPQPVAAAPEPVVAEAPATVPAPAAVDPAPVVLPQPAPAPVQTTQVTAHVFVRLSNGDRIAAGSFDNELAAEQCAQELMAAIDTPGSWPRVDGRYVRPDAILSIDLELTGL